MYSKSLIIDCPDATCERERERTCLLLSLDTNSVFICVHKDPLNIYICAEIDEQKFILYKHARDYFISCVRHKHGHTLTEVNYMYKSC